MANNQQIAEQVLAAVGGKANVSSVTHCMTRLRFVLVDESKAADDKTLEAIAGVLKVIRAGGQVQVVIGRNVDKVYDIVCERIGLEHAAQPAAEAELPQEKQKLTPKAVANNILGAVSGSLTPVLPVIIVAGIFKMVAVLFGPKNLGLLTAESQLYILCNLVNDAGFYFLPFFVAYSAAKRFKTDPILSMLVAALMLHPTMLDIVAESPSRSMACCPCSWSTTPRQRSRSFWWSGSSPMCTSGSKKWCRTSSVPSVCRCSPPLS